MSGEKKDPRDMTDDEMEGVLADLAEQFHTGFNASTADDVEAAKRWAAIPEAERLLIMRAAAEHLMTFTYGMASYGLHAECNWRIKPSGRKTKFEVMLRGALKKT